MGPGHLLAILVALFADAATPTAQVAGLANWVEIQNPSEKFLECANLSEHEWRVLLVDDALVVDHYREGVHDNTGPKLPFPLPRGVHTRAIRHVVAVPNGFLLGVDEGEWGGYLFWISKNGKTIRTLAEDNVHGIVDLGAGDLLALEGVNHMGYMEGGARWLKRTSSGDWVSARRTTLDAGPETFAVAGKVVYVLTAKSLTRIDSTREAHPIQPTRTADLYPNSMVVDDHGSLWVGMRHFVLRLSPNGGVFREHWMVRKECASAASRNECSCAKRGSE